MIDDEWMNEERKGSRFYRQNSAPFRVYEELTNLSKSKQSLCAKLCCAACGPNFRKLRRWIWIYYQRTVRWSNDVDPFLNYGSPQPTMNPHQWKFITRELCVGQMINPFWIMVTAADDKSAPTKIYYKRTVRWSNDVDPFLMDTAADDKSTSTKLYYLF